MDAKETREQAIRDAKVNLILDAARKVFSDKGFHETRLEDIGAAAGFSKASLYNYYEDKESIFLSLANRDFSRMLQLLRAEVRPEMPIRISLEVMFRTFLSFMGENFAFFFAVHSFRTVSQGTGEKPPKQHQELVAKFRDGFAQSMQLVVDVIKAAKARGEILTPLNQEVLAGFLTSLVRGVIFDWKSRGKTSDIDQTVGDIVSFVCQGMQVRPVVPARATGAAVASA
jgi:AcrR family transcriptional regulator